MAMTWASAKTYCSGASYRLPTLKELLSLVDHAVTSGATINQTAFPGTPAETFWTSSQSATSSTTAWTVGFGNGSTNYLDLGQSLWVRCVR